MNKVVSVSLIKNEEDIICSNIIHNSKAVDTMIILDNQSTDHTTEILRRLKDKGYNIEYHYDTTSDFQLIEKYDKLIKHAVNTHNADIILPLDADEFLAPIDTARKTLKHLPQEHAYHIYWQNYTPTINDNHYEPFIPCRITHRPPNNRSSFHKVIIPREIALNSTVTMGCHSITPHGHIEQLKDIYLAHYPIRTPQQLYEKVLKNYRAVEYDKTPGNHHHVKEMYKQFISDGPPSWEDLPRLIYYYIHGDYNPDEELINDPII